MARTGFFKRVQILLFSFMISASVMSAFCVQVVDGQQDIGLRYYNGTKAVAVAAEPVGPVTSPLRVFKNGATYGIELVDPSDACASEIRVQTSTGIKSLRLFGCVATITVQVDLTINNLIRNYGPGGEAACRFPWELRSGASDPMSVEIKDMSGNLIGAAKSITTNRLWGVGDTISSNPVTLIPGQQYRIIITPQEGRLYDTPFFNAYGIHVFGDANGAGGYDFGCATASQYFQQMAAAGCATYSGASYVNYKCDGTVIPQHCSMGIGPCGELFENEFYTYSCSTGTLGPWNVRKNMVCAYNDFPPAGDCFPTMQYYGCLPDVSSQGFSPVLNAVFIAGTPTVIGGDRGVTIVS